MPFVLVVGATIKCAHGGTLPVIAGDPLHTVNGKGIILSGKEIGLQFLAPAPGVLSPCPANNNGVAAPCKTTKATTGIATSFFIGGIPVLLDTATGATASAAGLGTWSVSSAGQTKLTAR
ncbi:hypothetical protein [Nocardia sp. XZ_19_385]|uniref:hypothetical protein n=1 Tax=Nocardia sp. XZ_19_385 TaxID=2769488 RepID=UPI00188DC6BC|nr:hypothetical protein [Nocardia sp. XZ_19_385]